MSDDLEDATRELAVCAAAKQLITRREAELKAMFGATKKTITATVDEADPLAAEIGRVSISKPRQGAPQIFDEDAAVGWAVEKFGGIAMCVRLSEQGKGSVIAAAKRGVPVPGVEVPDPTPGTLSFVPAKDVVQLVETMVAAGRAAWTSALPALSRPPLPPAPEPVDPGPALTHPGVVIAPTIAEGINLKKRSAPRFDGWVVISTYSHELAASLLADAVVDRYVTTGFGDIPGVPRQLRDAMARAAVGELTQVFDD